MIKCNLLFLFRNWPEFKKRLESKPNSSTFREYMGSLFSSKSDDIKEKKPINLISSEIYKFFDDVLASLVCCWVNESDSYMSKDLCLCDNGLMPYNVEELKFQSNMANEVIMSNGRSNRTNLKILKNQIINIGVNIYLNNPYEFMRSFLSLWNNDQHKYIHKDKQYKLSLIEFLVNLHIPCDIVIISVIKNINSQKLKELKKSKIKIRGSYSSYINKENAEYEAKILHLLYSYIIYNNHIRVDKTINDIWTEMINFLNIMLESKSPMTQFWLYEILNLMIIKLPIRELTEKKIKSTLIEILGKLFNTHMKFLNNNFEIAFEEPCQIITPINPSVYELVSLEVYSKTINRVESLLFTRFSNEKKENFYEKKTIDERKISTSPKKEQSSFNFDKEDNIKGFYKMLYDYIYNGTIIKSEELLVIYRNIGFITFKNMFYTTMKNVNLTEKNDKMVAAVNLIYIRLKKSSKTFY